MPFPCVLARHWPNPYREYRAGQDFLEPLANPNWPLARDGILIYFWSDPHFNHYNIIGLCNRQFKTVRQMNDSMIAHWNASVTPGDEIYLLGDFGFKTRLDGPEERRGDDLEAIYHQLNGKKHLIRGNHDHQNPKVFALPWASQQDIGEVNGPENSRFILCHYPIESWPGMWRGTVHLHGHCHGNLKRVVPRRFDVGVDSHAWPIPMEYIWDIAKTQKFEPQDG